MELSKTINEIYQTNAYETGNRNETKFPANVGSPVYGEIMYEGTESLVKKFSEHFNENTIFYDLGCGLGKMVLHIGLKYNPKKSIGIEYSKERASAAKSLKEKYAKDKENIIFEKGNVLDFDLSNATVVYMDNTVFPNHINTKIYNMIPKGCLILYKKSLIISLNKSFDLDFDSSKENLEHNLIKRTYHQKQLYWYIK